MELTCPNCSSRFRAPDEAFAGGPRKVRCGRCQHIWTAGVRAASHAAPEPQAGAKSESSQISGAPSSEAQDVFADYPVPRARDENLEISARAINAPSSEPSPAPAPAPSVAPAPEPSPYPETAGSPPGWPEPANADSFPRYQDDSSVRMNPKKRGGLTIGWILFFLVIVGLLAGGWHFRAQVVEKVPQLQKIYDMIDAQLVPAEPDSLELRGVTSVLRTIGGDRRMVIEGSVVNVSQETQPVSLLRAIVLDSQGEEITQWDFDPGAKTLEPGDRVEFSTSISAPEGESQLDLILVPR